MVNELNSTTEFFEFIGCPAIVIVDFYAKWCEPCQKFIKIWNRVETALAETDASIAKIDIDAHKEIASAFEVTKVPTFLYFKDGREVHRHEKILTIKEMVEIVNTIDTK